MDYSLQGKGARVLTGRNMDDDGSQSNGSGKSSLVMAPLWALTGRSDARAEVSHGLALATLPLRRHQHPTAIQRALRKHLLLQDRHMKDAEVRVHVSWIFPEGRVQVCDVCAGWLLSWLDRC